MSCQIPYIPERLHINNRPHVGEFFYGEILYRRCPKDKVKNPFDGISLVDLSVNRQGAPLDEPLCEPGDVLFNMVPENGKGERLDEAVVPLKILELDEEKQYLKSQSATTSGEVPVTNNCTIHLRHKVEPCNYAHAAFEVYYNGEEMTFDNYKQTLKKNTLLRTWCKNEISKMILHEEVWINWPNEKY